MFVFLLAPSFYKTGAGPATDPSLRGSSATLSRNIVSKPSHRASGFQNDVETNMIYIYIYTISNTHVKLLYHMGSPPRCLKPISALPRALHSMQSSIPERGTTLHIQCLHGRGAPAPRHLRIRIFKWELGHDAMQYNLIYELSKWIQLPIEEDPP